MLVHHKNRVNNHSCGSGGGGGRGGRVLEAASSHLHARQGGAPFEHHNCLGMALSTIPPRATYSPRHPACPAGRPWGTSTAWEWHSPSSPRKLRPRGCSSLPTHLGHITLGPTRPAHTPARPPGDLVCSFELLQISAKQLLFKDPDPWILLMCIYNPDLGVLPSLCLGLGSRPRDPPKGIWIQGSW